MRPIHSFSPLLLYTAGLFCAGLALGQAWVHRDYLIELTLTSYQNRYAAMTNQAPGPEQYYVITDTPERLIELVNHDDALHGLSSTLFGRLMVLQAAPGNRPSIESVRQLEGVSLVLESDLPIFCH